MSRTTSPIEAGYTRWSATYDTDRNLTRDLDQSALHALVASRRFGRVLELGCGTGKNTAYLATIAEAVHAVDFSEGMLGQARAKPFPSHVTFSQGDLTRRWATDDASTDLVTCNLVLEHIENLTHVFAEAARVLRDGGRMLVSELHPFRQYLGSQAGFTEGDTEVRLTAFTHHISDFVTAAESASLTLHSLREWWHDEDRRDGKPPRLLTLEFAK